MHPRFQQAPAHGRAQVRAAGRNDARPARTLPNNPKEDIDTEPVVRQPLPDEAAVRLRWTVRIAALVVSGSAWLLAIVVVLWFPAVWLVPGATSGTGRHWILAVVVTALCVAVGVAHDHVLHADLTSAANGFPVPAGPDAARQQQSALALLAIVLALPVWPQIVTVWTTNDGALVAPTALQLVVHTAPATVLTGLTVLIQWWVSRAIRAAHQAQRQLDVAEIPTAIGMET